MKHIFEEKALLTPEFQDENIAFVIVQKISYVVDPMAIKEKIAQKKINSPSQNAIHYMQTK